MSQLGPLIVGVQGRSLTPAEQAILRHPLIGGVILFTRNFANTKQLKTLTQQIKSLQQPELLITVDHEGGRVQRFHNGFTNMMPMGQIGKLYDDNPDRAVKLARTCGALVATELLQYQIDLSFAPVLDIDAGVSDIIGDRAFHYDPNVIVQLATALVEGMDSVGMAAVGKHFPGHGSVAPDSHLASVIDNRDFDQITTLDLVPFQLHHEVSLKGLMTAHVTYPKIDNQPASFSREWLHTILRQRLHFNGVIVSDDLGMAAAKLFGSAVDATKAALQAGCDMVLLCNEMDMIEDVLTNLPRLYYTNCTRQVGMLSRNRVVTQRFLQQRRDELLKQFNIYRQSA